MAATFRNEPHEVRVRDGPTFSEVQIEPEFNGFRLTMSTKDKLSSATPVHTFLRATDYMVNIYILMCLTRFQKAIDI